GITRLLDRPAEGEQGFEMLLLRRLGTGAAAHDIVEAQGLAAVGVVAVENRRLRLIGVDDRQHIADPRLAMQIELGNAANGDVVANQGPDHRARLAGGTSIQYALASKPCQPARPGHGDAGVRPPSSWWPRSWANCAGSGRPRNSA